MTNTTTKRSKSKVARRDANKSKKAELEIAFSDIVEILSRRLGLILAAIGASVAAASAYYLMFPPKFESKAEILVERRDANFNADGSNTTAESDVSRDLLATHMRIVQSKVNIADALSKTGLTQDESLLQAVGDNQTLSDYVVSNLYLTTGGDDAARNAHVISLRFRHTDPEYSKLVLQALVDQYQEFLKAKYQSDSTQITELIDTARKELEKELADLENEYRDFRQTAPILLSGEEASNVYEQRYEELMAEVATVDSQIAEGAARLQLVRDGLQRYDEMQAPDLQRLTLIDGINAERMSILLSVDRGEAETASFQAEQPERMASATSEFTSLLEKRAQLVSLEKALGNNHPEVAALRDQVRLAEEFVRTRAEQRSTLEDKPLLTPAAVLDAYVNLLTNDLEALQQRKTALLASSLEVESKVRSLVDFELKGEALLHERLRKQDLYDGTVENLRAIALSSGAGPTFIHEMLELPELGEQVEPNLLTAAAIALLGTLILGTGLVGVAELSDRSVHKVEELEQIFSSVVISQVPEFNQDADARVAMRQAQRSKNKVDRTVLVHHAPQSRMAEIFRGLRTQLMFAAGQEAKVLCITSAKSGEGKSTIAVNLACSLAQTGRSVLLVDCDMRRPQVAQLMGVSNKLGLRDILEGTAEVSDALQYCSALNVTVMPSGAVPKNPAELLDGRVFDEFLAVVREKFDVVLLDCPPMLPVSDPSIILPRADGTVMVVRVDSQSRPHSQRANDLLVGISARMIGLVINRSPSISEKYGYTDYSYQDYRPLENAPPSKLAEAAAI